MVKWIVYAPMLLSYHERDQCCVIVNKSHDLTLTLVWCYRKAKETTTKTENDIHRTIFMMAYTLAFHSTSYGQTIKRHSLILYSLLESAIWIRFNLCMSKMIGEAR